MAPLLRVSGTAGADGGSPQCDPKGTLARSTCDAARIARDAPRRGEEMDDMSKKFVAEESFWNLFPNCQIGVVVVEDLKPVDEVTDEHKTEIHKMLRRANVVAEKWVTEPTLSKNKVIAVWRSAYQQFKTKKGARVSIENLLKRAQKGNPVGDITPLVDIYNALSLSYALPFGAEDVDTFVGDLHLRVTEGGDAFDPLGEGNEPTLPGELAYVDDAGAVCRCWNWRDGQRTAITDATKRAIVFIESIDPDRADDLKAACDELAAALETYFGATVFANAIVTKDDPELVIEA